MGNLALQVVRVNLAALVHLAPRAPVANQVSWGSLVQRAMRVHPVRTEKEALVVRLEHLVLLGRTVMLASQVLLDLLVLLGREENQDQQGHLVSRDCLVDQDQLERMESLENQGQKVILEDPDSQALRVKMVSQVNVVHRVLQGLLEQGVGQVLLAQKVPRVLLDLLDPLEAQGCLAYRECQEKEELLEVLDQKGIRENLVAKVLMAFLVQEEREVMWVPLVLLVLLAHLEIRERRVRQEPQAPWVPVVVLVNEENKVFLDLLASLELQAKMENLVGKEKEAHLV